MQNLKTIDSRSLVAHLVTLAKSERASQIEILRCLSEIDERQIVADLGYGSIWSFCRLALRFSESTSTKRINVARAARQYPDLLTMLEEGSLTLCTAADLVALLTQENHKELMAKAAHKTRREVQALGVADGVKPVERDVIRRVPAAKKAVETTPLAFGGEAFAPGPVVKKEPAEKTPEPILHRVAFTAEDHVVQKLERLQEILGGASLAEVCDRAADLLLDKVDKVRRVEKREAKAKEAKTKASQPKAKKVTASKPEPRRPRGTLADKVFVEAGMRCTFVSKDGVRCAETRYLTIDHVRPYALGGRSNDKENLRCYCQAHNLNAGRKTFGRFNVHGERNHENPASPAHC
jgi:hypothetical protein